MTSTRCLQSAIALRFWSIRRSASALWKRCCRTIIRGSNPISTVRAGELLCSPKPSIWQNPGRRSSRVSELVCTKREQMETRAHYVAVGAFVLAVTFLDFVGVLWLGCAEFAQETKRYHIYFRGSVAGLNKGSQVQYNGIPVCRVIDIRVDPSNL